MDDLVNADSTKTRASSNEPSPLDALLTMLVWDAEEAVAKALDSLSATAARGNRWRLFILDQGSRPPAADLLASFARQRPDRVHLERLDRNIGYPAGHNLLHRLALRLYEPRYLVTLNSDLVLHDPLWLDRVVDYMDAHPRVGLAGPTGVVYQRTPPERLGWCRLATPEESAAGRYDSISGALCIMREAMLGQIGLFDESFTPGYYEDTDLAFRAKSSGWRVARCDVPHAHQELGPEKSTSALKREQLAAEYGNFQKRNRNLFVERWLSPNRPPFDAARVRALFPSVYFPEAVDQTCLATVV